MNLRESLQNHPGATIVISSVTILAAVGLMVRSNLAGSRGSQNAPAKAYFTTDDGATLFVDDATRVPPFDHGGQQAVRAVTFTCDGGKTHWVQYLQKFDGDAQSPGAPQPLAGIKLRAEGAGKGLLVKRPGDARWVSRSDSAEFSRISVPQTPQDVAGGLIEMYNPD